MGGLITFLTEVKWMQRIKKFSILVISDTKVKYSFILIWAWYIWNDSSKGYLAWFIEQTSHSEIILLFLPYNISTFFVSNTLYYLNWSQIFLHNLAWVVPTQLVKEISSSGNARSISFLANQIHKK